jgi:hypothetical protein
MGAAIADGEPGLAAADRLCRACVDLLGVDGAAVSIVSNGVMHGTFGSSSELSRRLDEFQFTFGEGPCLDSVRDAQAVLVGDLQDPEETRWPAYAEAVLDAGVRAVYALPVPFANTHIGALDLYRIAPWMLGGHGLVGGFVAAELAAVPLLDLMAAQVDAQAAGTSSSDLDQAQAQLGPSDRLEVHQATGMVMAQLNVGPEEALVRLRAHAFVHGLTAAETARRIVARQLTLAEDRRGPGAGPPRLGRPS